MLDSNVDDDDIVDGSNDNADDDDIVDGSNDNADDNDYTLSAR